MQARVSSRARFTHCPASRDAGGTPFLAWSSAAAALVLLALAVPGSAAAGDAPAKGQSPPVREAGKCVKRARDDQRACIRNDTERCRQHFEVDLEGCFSSDATCARKCIAAQKACRLSPKADDAGCKLACASDGKVELEQCRKKADQRGCEAPVRVKMFKCKQLCSANSQPKIQECLGDLDECLGVCIRAAAAD